MTGTVLMRTVQVLEHAVADPEATPVSRLLFGAVGVFGLRGEPGLDGVAAATAPATYDPDTHTVGVDVGTGASQAAAGNHAHAGVYDPAGTAAAAVAAVTPASIGAIPASEKATPSGVATLDSGGKIPTSQLPALAITTNWVVASQAAMLALDAQEGDVAIRTDVSRSFILGTGPASTLGSWHELLTPTDSVLSVDGRTGTVTLGDLYAALVHGHAQSDITGLVTALAGKASTTHAAAHASGGSDPITPASIGANPLMPTPTKSGRWVSGAFGPFTTNQPAADLLVGIPYPVHVAHSLDRIGIYIQTSGSSGSVVRLGIFKADANGVDYTKVLDAGTIDGTQAAGGYSITIGQALSVGLYLLVMVSQGSPVTRPILYASGTQSTPGQYVMHSTSQAALVDSGTSLSVSGVSGALPSSITPARFGTAAPVVMGRVA